MHINTQTRRTLAELSGNPNTPAMIADAEAGDQLNLKKTSYLTSRSQTFTKLGERLIDKSVIDIGPQCVAQDSDGVIYDS